MGEVFNCSVAALCLSQRYQCFSVQRRHLVDTFVAPLEGRTVIAGVGGREQQVPLQHWPDGLGEVQNTLGILQYPTVLVRSV